jgi:NAD(P)H-hydrate epimerase
MRDVEAAAIENLGVPAIVLMENAARATADAIVECYPRARRIAIACGRGNNGGDGLALLRDLATRGCEATAFVAGPLDRLSADATRQFVSCEQLGLSPRSVPDPAADDEVNEDYELWVDALLGTGLNRPVEGPVANWVDWLGRRRGDAPLVSVDVPTGVDASAAMPPGPHVAADLTVALGFPKVANVLAPAADAGGRLWIGDLGVPLPEPPPGPDALYQSRREDLVGCLHARQRDAHKGTFGHVVVAGGSTGFSGAVVLAARAAVRGGAGLVTAAVPEHLVQVVDAGSIESMTLGLPKLGKGWSRGAVEPLLQTIVERTSPGALALGPGLGLSDDARVLARQIVARSAAPVVLDADGISAFAGDARALLARDSDLVITPHPGELARLLGVPVPAVTESRWEHARQAARETGAVVVLKGRQTLISDPALGTWVNPTGNPGMASGGSGDVLTGVVAALLAQGLDPPAAARLGVYAHGLAGDLAAERWGELSMAACDLVDELGAAFRSLEA